MSVKERGLQYVPEESYGYYVGANLCFSMGAGSIVWLKLAADAQPVEYMENSEATSAFTNLTIQQIEEACQVH